MHISARFAVSALTVEAEMVSLRPSASVDFPTAHRMEASLPPRLEWRFSSPPAYRRTLHPLVAAQLSRHLLRFIHAHNADVTDLIIAACAHTPARMPPLLSPSRTMARFAQGLCGYNHVARWNTNRGCLVPKFFA
jgi:hypothetical protein